MCVNKNEELLPFYIKAKELLNYDSETGIITWKVSRNKRIKIGSEAGTLHHTGYRHIGISINDKSKSLQAHRIAYFIYHGKLPNLIDHVNGIREDNHISNIRSCTSQQNTFNTGKRIHNTSGFKGVSWYKQTGKWKADIRHNGKKIHLGYYTCPKEASKAYEAKAKEIHGAFYTERNPLSRKVKELESQLVNKEKEVVR